MPGTAGLKQTNKNQLICWKSRVVNKSIVNRDISKLHSLSAIILFTKLITILSLLHTLLLQGFSAVAVISFIFKASPSSLHTTVVKFTTIVKKKFGEVATKIVI